MLFETKWTKILENNCHFYKRYSQPAKKWMESIICEILRKTKFVGIDLEITEEMKLTVAGWASRMLMGRKLGPFFFSHVNVVKIFSGSKVNKDALGLIEDGVTYCQICLAWGDVIYDIKRPNKGSSTILHEFAHALDQFDQLIDGIPKMLMKGDEMLKWNSVFAPSYIIDNPKGKKIWDYLDLSRYGTFEKGNQSCVDVSEMFAIATEKYFEDGESLKKIAPELYDQLTIIYKDAI